MVFGYWSNILEVTVNSRLCELRIDYLKDGCEVRNGDQKVRKYLFPEIFYGRQEVHKYFCTSVNINGRFT